MMVMIAQAGFLSDFAAVLTAITGLAAGILAAWKYLDERRKRMKVQTRNTELKQAIGALESTLADMQSLCPLPGEAMDQRILATIQELAEKVSELTTFASALRRDLDVLKQRRAAEAGPPPIVPPVLKPQNVCQSPAIGNTMDEKRRRLERSIVLRGLSPDKKDRALWASPEGRIPVVIIRRGAQNHRVLFPDGTDDKVAVSDLSPI